MAHFDPNSSDVDLRRDGDREPQTRSPEQDAKTEARTVAPGSDHSAPPLLSLAAKPVRFLGLWALVTIILVQAVKLFHSGFTFAGNAFSVIIVGLGIALALRYLASSQVNIAKTVALGTALGRLSRPIGSLLRMAWTFLLLGFVLFFIGQCSQHPNMPVENVFFIALESYWTWLKSFFSKLLWFVGWR